ncbi:MAG: M56 family metallopeptidase [Deltaproteobacteria bacterium]|nr:M56 family metallopeptidase [Deltaproteobacteria bacterium]
MTTLLFILITLGVSSGILLYLSYGIGGLLSLSAGALEFCQSFFEGCVQLFPVVKVGLLWAGSALILAGIIYGAVKGVLNLARASRAIRRLPLKERGGIVLIDDDAKTAFTHGLLRPRIYISKGLIRGLDRDELKGVVLHELHHRRRLHPLKFFLTAFIKDSFFYIPIIAHLASFALLKKEHEADRVAASSMKEPYTLAGALVKTAASKRFVAFLPVSFTGNGDRGVEARIKSLVLGSQLRFNLPGFKTLVMSIISAGFLVMTLALPLNAGLYGVKPDKACSTERCTFHIDKLGKDCKIHCEASEKGLHGHHGR